MKLGFEIQKQIMHQPLGISCLLRDKKKTACIRMRGIAKNIQKRYIEEKYVKVY